MHNAQTLSKVVALRVRYLFVLLSECFESVPEFTLKGSTDEQKAFFKVLGSLHQTDPKVHVAICTCDSLMGANEWACTWASVLGAHTTVANLVSDLTHRFGLEMDGADGGVELDRASMKGLGAGNRTGQGQGGDGNGDGDISGRAQGGEDEPKTEREDGAEDRQRQRVWTPCLVNAFIPNLKQYEAVAASPEAASLGFTKCSSIFLRKFEASLERILWTAWQGMTTGIEAVILDPAAGKDHQVMVTYPTPPGFTLPFMGNLTTQVSEKDVSDGKVMHVATVFGVKFYVQPNPTICVPAWAVKTVNRNDQAFFCVNSQKLRAIIVLDAEADVGKLKTDESDAEEEGDDQAATTKYDDELVPFEVFLVDSDMCRNSTSGWFPAYIDDDERAAWFSFVRGVGLVRL